MLILFNVTKTDTVVAEDLASVTGDGQQQYTANVDEAQPIKQHTDKQKTFLREEKNTRIRNLEDFEHWIEKFPEASSKCIFKVNLDLESQNNGGCVYSSNGNFICNSTSTTEFPDALPHEAKMAIVSNTNITIIPEYVLADADTLEAVLIENNRGLVQLDKLAFSALSPTVTCLYMRNNRKILEWDVDQENLLDYFKTNSEIVHLALDNNNISSLGKLKEPNLLPRLEYLSLALNNIQTIEKYSFSGLANSPVRFLNFQGCQIEKVAYGAFSHFNYLEHLNLRNNPHLFKLLGSLSEFHRIATCLPTSLESLDLSSNYITHLPSDSLFLMKDFLATLNLAENYFPELGTALFQFPAMVNLTDLNLDDCGIKTIADQTFQMLSSLAHLSLLGNKLVSLGEGLFLPSLHFLALQADPERPLSFPADLLKERNMSNLLELRIVDAKINALTNEYFYSLQNLETLSIVSSQIDYLAHDVFCLESLLSLQLAYSSSEYPLSWETLRGPDSLIFLDLTHSHFNIKETALRAERKRNIEVLNLTGIMSDVEVPMRLDFISGAYPNLTVLEVGFNNIKWNISVFGPDTKIESIQMRHNIINLILTDAMIEDFFNSTTLRWLDLSDNVFECNEVIYKFYRFAHQRPEIDVKDYQNGTGYVCRDPITHDIKSFKNFSTFGNEISDGWANISYSDSKNLITQLSISFFVAFIVTLTLSVIVYKNRWYIRYHYECYKQKKLGVNRSEPFLYDAFISYSNADEDWVNTRLVEFLENTSPGLKLCLHQRDFVIGQTIMENIVSAINTSRHVVIVLTESYAKSSWCMLESHLAQSRLLVGDSSGRLVILKLGDLNNNSLAKSLRHNLANVTYLSMVHESAPPSSSALSLPKAEETGDVAWKKLKVALMTATEPKDRIETESYI